VLKRLGELIKETRTEDKDKGAYHDSHNQCSLSIPSTWCIQNPPHVLAMRVRTETCCPIALEPPEKINPIDPRNHLSPTSITPPIASNVATPPQQTSATSSAVPVAAPSIATTAPGVTTDALQSTLLALLSQAANNAPNGANGWVISKI
jgi:hypothetical protein